MGDGNTIASALTTVQSLVSTAVSTITGNEILFVMFAAGLVGIGFRVVRQAKRTSNS